MKNFLVCSFVLFKFVISQNIKNYRFQVSPKAKQKRLVVLRMQNSCVVWQNIYYQTSTTNFQIQNQNISFCPRGAWQIVVNSAPFVQSTTFAEFCSARNSAVSDKIANWQGSFELCHLFLCRGLGEKSP